MDIKSLDVVLKTLEELKDENKDLSTIGIETAFTVDNKDVESLLRCLLKYEKIKLKDGIYQRKDFDWEKNMSILGLEKEREKCFYIEDDKVDEYVLQLEHKLRNSTPNSKIREYKKNFIEDSQDEETFTTQSAQINASLISFCNELLGENSFK